MDKLCATCSKQLRADQDHCDQCGSSWTAASDSGAIPTGPVVTSERVAAPPPPKSSNKTLISVLIVAILLLFAGGGFFISHRARSRALEAATAATITAGSRPANSAAPVPLVNASAAAAPSEAAVAQATAAASSSRQCSLITPAQMGAILGSKIVKLTAVELTCAYFTDDNRYVTVDTTWTGGKEALATTKGFPGAEDLFKAIPGIGDEAYSQLGGVLHLLKGNTYVVVNSRQYPDELVIESAIATTIVANLK